jgi:tetratricopeptide (TPR) repeat protein
MKKGLFVLVMLFLAFNSSGQVTKTYFDLGNHKFEKEDYKGAVVYYTKAIESKNEESKYNSFIVSNSYLFRGISKNYLGDYTGAVLDLTKSISLLNYFTSTYNISIKEKNDLTGMFAHSLYYRSMAKSNKSNFNEALIDINEAIKLDEKNPTYLIIRGRIKLQLNQKTSACLDFSRAGELGADDAYNFIKENCN